MRQPRELLKYHPCRYLHSRPFFQPLFKMFEKYADANGVLPASAVMRIGEKLTRGYWNPALTRFPVEMRPDSLTQMVSEHSMFCHVAQFTHCGRNIFDVLPTLRELLSVTDVDDVLWRSIRLPYPALYLWFGPQDHLRFGNGQYFADGAYVSSVANGSENVLQIFVTTQERGIDYSHPPSFVVHRDFYYYISFQFADERETVGATLNRVLRTSPDYDSNFEPPSIAAETKQEALEHGITLTQRPGKDTAQGRVIQERIADLPVFRQVLRLVINGLCYLSSPSSEVARKYSEHAQEKLSRTSPSKVQHERQRLNQQGYTEINFCGESLEREYAAVFTGRELSPHWRRGHWRNQAVGHERSDHHLIWIRPTLVRKDKQHDGEVVGHIYDVEK